jgi:hypothetical protein
MRRFPKGFLSPLDILLTQRDGVGDAGPTGIASAVAEDVLPDLELRYTGLITSQTIVSDLYQRWLIYTGVCKV